jgi:serralysin
VEADGTISDTHILFSNTLNVGASARTVDLGTAANGERFGFFLIQNGFNVYGSLPDNLSFLAPGTGTLADLDSGVPPVLASATLGALTSAPVFHSFATLNPANEVHVLSGASRDGRELQIGFEDLPQGATDNDFQDIVIGLRVSPGDSLRI